MIQFNLLPDVKLEYIKARTQRRLVMGISVIAVGVSVGLLILVFTVGAFQKKHLSDLNDDITSESNELKQKPHINKILTVQNQLQSLTGLHAAKPSASRLFGYLNELTPANTGITSFNIDFNEHTIKIEGTADALSTVNKYADTLKFTTYKLQGEDGSEDSASSSSDKSQGTKAFSNVVLSSFGVGKGEGTANAAASKATFNLTLSYDPVIFDTTKNVNLVIPQLVTTRSQVLQPTDLFTESPVTTDAANGGGR